ncbi:Putative protease Do-like 3 [Raphanus sativus]|uniref:Protease Do-like 3, mitochondrial n=1 Tax=Raphanus sativus TaxID=3726 RepID=A0A9W3C084_RAPSA|nr:putative protease Do-like 3, mitochondrial [Raphanus sativus]KAJ4891036.1 Putative protease Do-like 3 [Raphanus sativus]
MAIWWRGLRSAAGRLRALYRIPAGEMLKDDVPGLKKGIKMTSRRLLSTKPDWYHLSDTDGISRSFSSVVQIYSIFRRANVEYPWSGSTSTHGVGSGFIIQGRKIITNAHVVNQATSIQMNQDTQALALQSQNTSFPIDSATS